MFQSVVATPRPIQTRAFGSNSSNFDADGSEAVM